MAFCETKPKCYGQAEYYLIAYGNQNLLHKHLRVNYRSVQFTSIHTTAD